MVPVFGEIHHWHHPWAPLVCQTASSAVLDHSRSPKIGDAFQSAFPKFLFLPRNLWRRSQYSSHSRKSCGETICRYTSLLRPFQWCVLPEKSLPTTTRPWYCSSNLILSEPGPRPWTENLGGVYSGGFTARIHLSLYVPCCFKAKKDKGLRSCINY